ncbi:hypothetical protein JJJ17_04370 [Paracoccus caeni]|uniref:Lipoprotein n=1 Tax=Paracoccus caeni TaxID=657651 RepID=A0A934SD45_9RHOB|nr:hypothetical protein [Paracoccus caeni]MBK4215155.1 hypothetical protein [Paracoccus caeni]
MRAFSAIAGTTTVLFVASCSSVPDWSELEQRPRDAAPIGVMECQPRKPGIGGASIFERTEPICQERAEQLCAKEDRPLIRFGKVTAQAQRLLGPDGEGRANATHFFQCGPSSKRVQ